MINRCTPLVLSVKPLLLYSVCYRGLLFHNYVSKYFKIKKKHNEKIRAFVKDKIDNWVNEEEEAESLRNEAMQNINHREEN